MFLHELSLNKAESFLKLLNDIPQMLTLFPIFFCKLLYGLIQEA